MTAQTKQQLQRELQRQDELLEEIKASRSRLNERYDRSARDLDAANKEIGDLRKTNRLLAHEKQLLEHRLAQCEGWINAKKKLRPDGREWGDGGPDGPTTSLAERLYESKSGR